MDQNYILVNIDSKQIHGNYIIKKVEGAICLPFYIILDFGKSINVMKLKILINQVTSFQHICFDLYMENHVHTVWD